MADRSLFVDSEGQPKEVTPQELKDLIMSLEEENNRKIAEIDWRYKHDLTELKAEIINEMSDKIISVMKWMIVGFLVQIGLLILTIVAFVK
jgi:hypothetical protein